MNASKDIGVLGWIGFLDRLLPTPYSLLHITSPVEKYLNYEYVTRIQVRGSSHLCGSQGFGTRGLSHAHDTLSPHSHQWSKRAAPLVIMERFDGRNLTPVRTD
jgi:hypothetical protein